MSDKQNKVVIIAVIGIAVVLIGGGWLFFSFLDTNQPEVADSNKLQTELEVVKMKNLAEENLQFFNPANNRDSLWSKRDNSFQYLDLDKNEPPVTFDLNNPGNPHPFDQPAPDEEAE